jgi:dihydropyrimidinase
MRVRAVTGGTVLTSEGLRRADVIIRGGKIAGLGVAGHGSGQRIDAAGCYVLPGGVDPHCHLMADVQAATAAAVLGGTTTALSFTNPEAGEGDLDCLLRRRTELARDGTAIDLGLHAMLYAPARATMADLIGARQAGAAAVKVFLAYPELGIMASTGTLFELMSSAKRLGMIVQVHCEDGALIEVLVADALRSGRRGARVFADTRPPESEEAAVAEALAIASLTGAACYLVHLSTAGAIEQVRQARKTGRPRVFAEVCLHHLLLDDRRYASADAERYLVAPPLRAAHHVEALWQALADGTVDTVGSDHSQVRSATIAGLAPGGGSYDYGLAGIGARLPLLLSAGLARGVPLSRLMEVASSNPARIFGHYPRKGVLAVGSDADLVVYDPAGETRIGPDALSDGTGESVYVGLPLLGRIRAVLLRGNLAAVEGRFVGAHRGGRYQAASALELLPTRR